MRDPVCDFTPRQRWFLTRELALSRLRSIEHNTFLGILWSLINPVVMLGVLFWMFHRSYGKEIPAYPLYLLTGVVTVNFFTASTTYVANALYVFRQVAMNTVVPRSSLLAADFMVFLVKFAIEFVLCLLLGLYYGLTWWSPFLLAFLIVVFVAFSFAIGVLLALASCFVRDVQHIWAIGARFLLFITPIFYRVDDMPTQFRTLIRFINPLSPFVRSFQQVFAGHAEPAMLAQSAIVSFVACVLAFWAFRSLEQTAMEQV